jgi:site-specific recombinase XerD
VPDSPAPARSSVHGDPNTAAAEVDPFPEWFIQFLDGRQTRKPSAHTIKAYRQDFIAIATLMSDGDLGRLAVTDITRESMRSAFAAYAKDHEAASIRRCWSTWNVLCTFLYTSEQLAANPMQLVGRPKLARPLPKALPAPLLKRCLKPSGACSGAQGEAGAQRRHRRPGAQLRTPICLTDRMIAATNAATMRCRR